jgi:transcriptional regulator
MSTERSPILQGTLDMLILQQLRWGARHGYGIGQAIRAGSNAVLLVETGSLYPALQRLEKRRLIRSEWRTTDRNHRARFYSLTPAGRKRLADEQSRWKTLVKAIAATMRARPVGDA